MESLWKMSENTPQVNRKTYFGSGYMKAERFASYGRQLQEISELLPCTVLEIGIGNGVVKYMLKNAGVEVTTVDFDPSLAPDYVSDVTALPFDDNSFDTVICFEVLEHLPYEDFKTALKEIHRVVKKNVLFSLPDAEVVARFEVYIPVIGRTRFFIRQPMQKTVEHKFDGEHYWEINKKDFPLSRIKKDVENTGFNIDKSYRVWEKPCHRFFITTKISA